MQFFPKKKALMYWKNHYGKIVNISSMHTRELPAKYYVGSTDMRTEDIAYLLGYRDKKEIPPAPPGVFLPKILLKPTGYWGILYPQLSYGGYSHDRDHERHHYR